MSHTHKVNDRDPYFEIDAVTRKIINKSTSKVSVIQYDHNSEHFTFSLPRYIEDHDMLDCTKAEVHYICAKTKTPGIYEMKDLAVDPEDENKVICTWELSQNVTLEAGAIGFLLRFSCVAEDGTIEYAWNTAIFNGISVAEGIYNAEAIVEQYADILEQWKAEVTAKYTEIQRSLSELESNQSEIQGSLSRTRELLSDFREDQSAMYTTGRILFSNAIKESGSGKVIRFDDVSPIEHNVKVKISGDDIVNMSRTKVHTFGKNIFGFEESFSVTQGGITIDYDNETQIFTLNGTHEKGTSALVIYLNKYYAQHTNLNIFKLDKNEMFTFTVECLGGTVSEESSTNSICITGSDVPSWSGGNLAAVKISEVKKQIKTLYSPYDYVNGLYFHIYNTVTLTDYKIRLQVEIGEKSTDFEKYKRTTYTANADGTVDVLSISPTMTLSVCPHNVVNATAIEDGDAKIETECNKDLNKVLEKLQNAIISLGGNI